MKFFEKMFGGSNGESEKISKEELYRNPDQEIINELKAIELNDQSIHNASPTEIHEIELRIRDLHRALNRQKEFRKSDYNYSKEVGEIHTEDKIIDYFKSLSGRQREFLNQWLNEEIIKYEIEDKFREYDKEHLDEMIEEMKIKFATNKLNPFGDSSQWDIDYYSKKGIDIANPTEEDAKKYIEGLTYHSGAIGVELDDRLDSSFEDIEPSIRNGITSLLFIRLIMDPTTEKTLPHSMVREKIREIKQLMENP